MVFNICSFIYLKCLYIRKNVVIVQFGNAFITPSVQTGIVKSRMVLVKSEILSCLIAIQILSHKGVRSFCHHFIFAFVLPKTHIFKYVVIFRCRSIQVIANTTVHPYLCFLITIVLTT